MYKKCFTITVALIVVVVAIEPIKTNNDSYPIHVILLSNFLDDPKLT